MVNIVINSDKVIVILRPFVTGLVHVCRTLLLAFSALATSLVPLAAQVEIAA